MYAKKKTKASSTWVVDRQQVACSNTVLGQAAQRDMLTA
jgi:hypothetical protein